LLLPEKPQEPDFSPVFEGFALYKGRVAFFFPAYQDVSGELPLYYLFEIDIKQSL
jgi:hypothetical protein